MKGKRMIGNMISFSLLMRAPGKRKHLKAMEFHSPLVNFQVWVKKRITSNFFHICQMQNIKRDSGRRSAGQSHFSSTARPDRTNRGPDWLQNNNLCATFPWLKFSTLPFSTLSPSLSTDRGSLPSHSPRGAAGHVGGLRNKPRLVHFFTYIDQAETGKRANCAKTLVLIFWAW